MAFCQKFHHNSKGQVFRIISNVIIILLHNTYMGGGRKRENKRMPNKVSQDPPTKNLEQRDALTTFHHSQNSWKLKKKKRNG